jgi:SAM-dependent methyltransferase
MSYRLTIEAIDSREPFYRPLYLGADVDLRRSDCPICESSAGLRLVSRATGSVETSICCSCNHFFFSRRPPDDWFSNHYRHDWYKGGLHGAHTSPLPRRVARGLIDRVRGRVSGLPRRPTDVEKHFDFCRDFVRAGDAVLEVGAGNGRLLTAFRRMGCRTLAVEPSPASAAACTAKGIEVVGGSIEEVERSLEAKVSLLFSNHSIEHHSDPNVFLRFASRTLAPGGALCVAVPNHASMFLFAEMFFVLHIHCFTEQSLTRLLEKHGFTVIRKEVDLQLRFLARRNEAAPVRTGADEVPDLDGARARERYQRRLAASLLGAEQRTIPSGKYSISYQNAAAPRNDLWGHYEVEVRRQSNGEALPSAGRYRTTTLLEVDAGAGEAVVELAGPGDSSPPVFVK